MPVGQTVTSTPIRGRRRRPPTPTRRRTRRRRERAAPWRRPARRERGDRPTTPTTIPAPAGGATGSAAPTARGPDRPRAPRRQRSAAAPAPAAPPPRRRRRQQRPGRPRPGLRGQRAAGAHRLPVGGRAVREHRHGRDRPGGPAAVAADHRRAAVRAGRRALQAPGQHPQPGARPVPRRRRGRLLPGELVPPGRHQACSAGTSTPPAGSSPSTRTAPDSSKTPEFFLATQDNGGGADAGHRDDQRAAGIKIGRRAPVHVVGR